MQVIKLGLISVVVFALLITGFSLFFPSHVRISKAIDINGNRDSVWALVNDPANWQQWFPGGDSLQPLFILGKIKGVVTDNKQGLIMETATDSTVTANNAGLISKRAETGWNIYPGHDSNSMTIQMYMDFRLRWYPWEKFSSLLLEKRYGPFLEKGLENLKKVAER